MTKSEWNTLRKRGRPRQMWSQSVYKLTREQLMHASCAFSMGRHRLPTHPHWVYGFFYLYLENRVLFSGVDFPPMGSYFNSFAKMFEKW